MNTAILTIKTDPDLKAEVKRIAEEPSDYLIKTLEESEADRKEGRYHSFSNAEDALGFLDSLKNDKHQKN